MKALTDITPREFGLVRFLVFCAWDYADEEGWVNFSEHDGSRMSLRSRINDEDIDMMDSLEEMGLIENRGTGLYPSVRIKPEGWNVVSFVSGMRYKHDPGWKKRKEPMVPEEEKAKLDEYERLRAQSRKVFSDVLAGKNVEGGQS